LKINKIDECVKWVLVSVYIRFINKETNDSILLVPADDLIGGFGDDVMVMSFIENFGQGRPISIFTQKKIIRNDYLSNYGNITYIEGFKERNYFHFAKVLKEHSLVYILGADIMDGSYGYYSSIDRIRMLRLAEKIGVKNEISGFSVSNNILPTVQKELIKVSKHTIIKARDIDSYNRLNAFLPSERLLLTNDIAFICPDVPSTYRGDIFDNYLEWSVDVKDKSGMIIGFCSNSIQAKKMGLDNYLKSMIDLISKFLKRRDFSIVFLYHDTRPLCDLETDKTISEKLYKHFVKNNVNCFFPSGISNGVELKGYLHQVDFTLTGRMHLGISGITSSKPMFGVCYANKFEGMVRLFGINPEFCLIEYNDLTHSEEIIDGFINNFDDIKYKTEGIGFVKKTTLKNYCI
jgi:polysaccharide pyruvyl transferase WcaK-like protein